MSEPSLEKAVAAAWHDLGRAVQLAWRWLDPDADAEARREALRSDLLATRRGPDGTFSAVQVWERHREALRPLADDPDLLAVERAMARIRESLPALDAPHPDPAVLAELAGQAAAVRGALRRLRDRFRGPGG